MVGKTRFDKKTLQNIIRQYDVGDFVSSKSFSRGYVQTNILIHTNKGKYVLRYYENRDKKRVKFESKLLEYLSKRKYLVATPIQNRIGTYIGIYDNKPYVLFDYIKGIHIKKLTKQQLRELVHKLALLHKITKNYNDKRYIHIEPRNRDYCLRTAHTEMKRFGGNKEGVRRYNIIKSQLDTLNFPNMPKSIIHLDFDMANIKFFKGKVSGILDFDDSYYDYRIFDLGVMIMYWSRKNSKTIKLNLARDIIKYYEEICPLNKIEKEHLFDAIKMSCLMIMSWLMYDKWKGKDLFIILHRILIDLDNLGRDKFYKLMFKK